MKSRTQASFAGAPLLVGVLFCAVALAQEPAPPAQPEATPEPAVDTSAAADAQEQADTAAEPKATEGTGAADQETESAERAAAEPAGEAGGAARGSNFRTMDRLDLDSSAITGNRELPKVLYIVPWKKADLGDLVGRPANTLLDEVLTPVDREVFRRQTEYFSTLEQGASGSQEPVKQPAPPPAQ